MAQHRMRDSLRDFYQRFWYIPDIVAVVFLFLYMTFLNLAPADYIGGLHNDGAWTFKVGLGYACAFLPLAVVCVLIVAFQMGVTWPRHIQNPRRLLRLRLLVGLGLGIYFVFFFTPIRPAGYKVYTLGLQKYARANVDIPAIRTWLSTLDPNVAMGDRVALREVRESERGRWPGAIMSLSPDYLELCLDCDNRPVVRLAWSGFDAMWGIAVGSEDMEIPRTQPRRKVKIGDSFLYDHGEYRLPVEPGVYVWHEIR